MTDECRPFLSPAVHGIISDMDMLSHRELNIGKGLWLAALEDEHDNAHISFLQWCFKYFPALTFEIEARRAKEASQKPDEADDGRATPVLPEDQVI